MHKAGTYYIGDLCYILKDENGWNWMFVLDKTDFLEGSGDGYYEIDGVQFFLQELPMVMEYIVMIADKFMVWM